MMTSWWFLWMIFMFFLITPVSYGAYRGWGPPYPRYIQRRRGAQAAVSNAAANFNHHAWGVGGDIMWMAFVIGSIWGLSAFFWR